MNVNNIHKIYKLIHPIQQELCIYIYIYNLINQVKSYKSALSCDSISAFGGIVSCNYKIKKKLAIELNKIFFEVIIANGYEKEALKIFKKKKKLRLIDAKNLNK